MTRSMVPNTCPEVIEHGKDLIVLIHVQRTQLDPNARMLLQQLGLERLQAIQSPGAQSARLRPLAANKAAMPSPKPNWRR